MQKRNIFLKRGSLPETDERLGVGVCALEYLGWMFILGGLRALEMAASGLPNALVIINSLALQSVQPLGRIAHHITAFFQALHH